MATSLLRVLFFVLGSVFLSACFGGLRPPPEEPVGVGLGAEGEHEVCTYTEGLADSGYSSARLSYPCDVSGPLASTTLTGGYTNTKEQMYWLADHLGSHGYAVLAITPSNRFGTPPVWQRAHIAGFHKLAEENGRAGSPLFGQIDPDRRAIMGFSMGGGGTLLAAGEMGEGFATAIALAPWLGTTSPDYFNIAEPVLVLGSADDSLSPPGPVGSYFMSLPTDITRGLAIYRDANHADWMGSGNQPQKARFRALVTAWMNWLLREDESARGYFDGAEHDEHMAEDWFTRFEFRP